MKRIADDLPGYTYGTDEVAESAATLQDLDRLKLTVGWNSDDDRYLLPGYVGRSNLRLEQWILDTCLRAHDQAWLDYQYEIAIRHTSARKNQTDSVHSTAYVPLSDLLAFFAVINETIRPFLAAKGHSTAEVDGMHRAWRKSMHVQAALIARAYTNPKNGRNEW